MFHPDDSIGPYTLVRTLGRGAYGEVWLAERRSSIITTQVALKLPLDASADLDAIRREAQVWLKASGHINIVPVMDAEVYDGQVVIASEYMEGGSLADWLAHHGGKGPSVDAAVGMMRGILAGLQHLHQNNLIHRDLKPDNVLLQGSTPRLTDFGLTRVLKPSRQSTNLAGTPRYMSPEAFQGEYSPACDLWAAGMLLHELLVGTLPYPQTDFYALLLAITSELPVVLSDEISETLRSVLERALAKSLSERFASAAEMAETLELASSARLASASISQAEPRNNLPQQVTSFIGREKEITEIRRLLRTTRLMTLTGIGGCGKTRLSLRVATEVLENYPDGAWMVELASLSDPALVPQAVGVVLGLREEVGKPLVQTLVEALKSKNLLLLLDNCEHLLTACAQLVDAVVRACPLVRVLATSREALGISGETIYRIPTLSLPDLKQTTTMESLSAWESVRLFVDRATASVPAFVMTNANAPALASLCHRLDGLPLAIELSAARVRSLSVEEIDARLDHRFRLLTGGSRTAVKRQQTLRSLIDWSYDLLNEQEKTLLCRLSVFAGGWTVEAAEAVGSGDDVEDWEVLDLLMSLVDKSLVVPEQEKAQTRYRLLETIREYARDRLEEHGEGEAVRARHQSYFLALAEEAAPKLHEPDQAAWLHRLEREHDNLRAALEWGKQNRTALRIAGALRGFWLIRGYFSEGRERLTRVLASSDAQAPVLERAKALRGAGTLAQSQGDYLAAQTLYRECLSLYQEVGDPRGVAASLNDLGYAAYNQGDYAEARTFHEESLVLHRELGDKHGIAWSLHNLGMVAQEQGNYPAARTLHEESLALRREFGDKRGIAWSLHNLGYVARNRGDYTAARALHEESLLLHREVGDKTGIAYSLVNLGMVVHVQRDYAAASMLYAESLAIQRELGDKQGISYVLQGQGNVARNLCDYTAARKLHEESLGIERDLGNKQGIARSLHNLAMDAHDQGDYAAARTLQEESLALQRELGDKQGIAWSLVILGHVAIYQGDDALARTLLEESLAMHRDLGNKQGIVECLESFAILNTRGDKCEKAARLWGAGEQLRDEIGSPLTQVEQAGRDRAVTTARQSMDEDNFAAAWAEGRAMSLDHAVEYALDVER